MADFPTIWLIKNTDVLANVKMHIFFFLYSYPQQT